MLELAAIPAIDYAVTKVKALWQAAGKIRDLETQAALQDIQQALLTAKAENLELKAQLLELQTSATLEESLNFDGKVYWKRGKEDEGAFCPRCWDADKKLVHLHRRSGSNTPRGWNCRACEKFFRD